MEWILSLLKIIRDALLIEESYQEWENSLFEVCKPRNIRRGDGNLGGGEQVYDDIQVAGTWNNCRAVRIHLHEVLVRCCSLATSHAYAEALELDFIETEGQSRAVIQDLIEDIAASVSFCLGEIDSSGNPGGNNAAPLGGYLLLWPVTAAMASSDEERYEWFREKLALIADKMGVRMAQMIRDSLKKDTWDLNCPKPEVPEV